MLRVVSGKERDPESPTQDDVILLRESGPRNRNCTLRRRPLGSAAPYGIRPGCLDLPQVFVPGRSGPACYGLARRPLQRGANFGDRLVAVIIQFLESLLQRTKFSGAFGRPFPIDIESVGGRWTGRRRLRSRQHCQRRHYRCVVTVAGRHFCTPHAIGSRPDECWCGRALTS